jgi:hypothetical protein
MSKAIDLGIMAVGEGAALCAVAYVYFQIGKRIGYAEGLKFKKWFQGRASEGEGQTQSAPNQGLGGISRAQNPYWNNPTVAQNTFGPNQQQLQKKMQAALNSINNLKS